MLRLIFLIVCFFFVSGNAAGTGIPRNWQLGLGAPQTVKTPAWDYTVARGASRTAGVAPLSVFFSAGLEKSTPTKRTFHNYEYSWDFGDDANDKWGTNGKSKNSDKGPVAAHVYEEPGTYKATLRVRGASGEIDTESFTITVSDPDVVFSGTKTTCVSTNSDFSGCPAGADTITTTDLSDLPSWTGSGERLLFHRGSSWKTVGGAYPDYPAKAEVVRIGAYGRCTSPDSNGICSNAPSIVITGEHKALFNLYNNPDWVIADLSLKGSKSTKGLTAGVMGLKQLLVLRVKVRGTDSAIGWGHWRTKTLSHPSEMAIVSCDVRDFRSYGVYAGAEKFFLMGNQIHNSDLTHVARIWWGYQAVISHNVLTGSSLKNANGRHALKFHGPKLGTEVGSFEQTGSYGLPYSTEFAVVANNVFGTSGPWPVSIGPQDNGANEQLSDIIFEKNLLLADYGQNSSRLWTIALHIKGSYLSIRNNIFDGSYDTEDPGDFIAIEVGKNRALANQTGAAIYNNTIYCDGNENQNGLTAIKILSGIREVEVKNNYVSFPDETHSKVILKDESGEATYSNNVLTDTPGFRDSRNSNPIERDFSISSKATEAIRKGAAVPVFDDFSGVSRTAGSNDVGAYAF